MIDSSIVGFEEEKCLKGFEEDKGKLVTRGKPSFDLMPLS
jgi:hypothetical protein